jgi:hypothetical protein
VDVSGWGEVKSLSGLSVIWRPKAKPVELPVIPAELLEQVGNGPMTAEAINAAMLALKTALIERALGGETNHHLGYSSGAAKPPAVSSQRNSKGAKTDPVLRISASDSQNHQDARPFPERRGGHHAYLHGQGFLKIRECVTQSTLAW